MTGDEVMLLLARVQGHDNREITPQNQLAWVETLGKVPYSYAVRAVQHHFANSSEYLTPGIVLRLAQGFYADERRESARQAQTAQRRSSEEIRAAALQRAAVDREERIERQQVAAEDYGKRALRHIRAAIANVARVHERIPHGEGVRVAEAAWQEFRAFNGPPPAVSPRSNPCGNALCHCSHTEGCEAGWISVDPGDFASGVIPCPQCKPKASAIVDAASTTGDRRGAMQLLREQKKAETTTGQGDEW